MPVLTSMTNKIIVISFPDELRNMNFSIVSKANILGNVQDLFENSGDHLQAKTGADQP
jgi:hypothetical protein